MYLHVRSKQWQYVHVACTVTVAVIPSLAMYTKLCLERDWMGVIRIIKVTA